MKNIILFSVLCCLPASVFPQSPPEVLQVIVANGIIGNEPDEDGIIERIDVRRCLTNEPAPTVSVSRKTNSQVVVWTEMRIPKNTTVNIGFQLFHENESEESLSDVGMAILTGVLLPIVRQSWLW